MKDLMTLIQHPSMQGCDRIVLISGKPIILILGDDKKAMGQALANQQIMNLLKASLPQETLAAFGWGKELNCELEVDGNPIPVKILLKPDKSFHVEISLSSASEAGTEEVEEEAPMELALSAPMPSPTDEPPTVPVMAPRRTAPAAAVSGGDQEVSESLIEELISGNNLALIYYRDTNQLAQIEQAVGDFGFDPRRCNLSAAVNEVLKYQDYPLFILQLGENFLEDPVYQNLATMTMNRRRKQYSVLVAPGLKSNDAMLAFSLSVNQVVASNEIHLLYEHVHAQMGSWKRFVGAFHDVLGSQGKL